MNYVRGISSSVSKTWNSINPATLSGAIDVIVVEQEDGSLACSPFHIRFGKFSLLRPSEKKVEFKINGEKQEYPMKLGEGGEAFFVFETMESIPEALQTSPLVSPVTSPVLRPSAPVTPALQEPDPFELEGEGKSIPSLDGSPDKRAARSKSTGDTMAVPSPPRAKSDSGRPTPMLAPPEDSKRYLAADFPNIATSRLTPKLSRNATDSDIPATRAALARSLETSALLAPQTSLPARPPSPVRSRTDRSTSPPPWSKEEAYSRAVNLSKKLWTSNIATQISDSGDLMLDMTGYKSDTSEALQAEGIARKLLSQELEGPYDIGALIGADEKGNLWIYSSEEAKQVASQKAAADGLGALQAGFLRSTDALSDPGYGSDDARSDYTGTHIRRDSDSAIGMNSSPSSPGATLAAGDPNRNYAKTLRLTSDQLKSMNLKLGANAMSFSVNRATCTATLWYWKHDVPIVISDIDGTITKSDVLGHVLTTIGRDWTHSGVAKLYTEIAANGYNFMYLTSRSVGQADSTKGYLDGVAQDGFRLPKGPVILSPDRTIAALRREVYLRKPEIFKMACLRDIMALFAGHGGANDIHASAAEGLHANPHGNLGVGRGRGGSPFYAGFGNRLTDALSYRSVNIPSTRIFTINSNSEVSLDLLSLNTYKTGYASMREIVDHYFPPVGLRLLTQGGDEGFTDFNYWRDKPLDLVDFTESESEDGDDDDDERDTAVRQSISLDRTQTRGTAQSVLSDGTVLSEDEAGDDMLDSYLSEPRASLEESLSNLLENDEFEVEGGDMGASMLEEAEEESEEDSDEDIDDDGADEGEDEGPRTPDLERAQGEDVQATPRGSERTRSRVGRKVMLDESDLESEP
jgi:phosphatidate phosphatase LPIN